MPALGARRLEDATSAEVEAWVGRLGVVASSRRKALVILHGIFQRARKVYGLAQNPVSDIEKPPLTRSGDIDVFSPEEVFALARAAESEQDAAIFLTAAFTGLRMGELLALHWRDVDFSGEAIRVRASYSMGVLMTPKSGKIRSVPLAPDVAETLARLGARERPLARTTSCSPARPASTSTGRRCGGGTPQHSAERVCGGCASTTCATLSGRA